MMQISHASQNTKRCNSNKKQSLCAFARETLKQTEEECRQKSMCEELVDGVVILEVETIACTILTWQGCLPYRVVQDFA
jgi:ribosomal protein S3AE